MTYKIDCLKSVKNDWYHKWCCLLDYKLHDCVKGPLKYPMVAVSIPYITEENDEMDRCNCNQHTKKCYSRPGIPDPWDEYLIYRREAEKGTGVAYDFPKCDLDITGSLNQHYRVYLGQGIPDPWKKMMHLELLEPRIDNGGRKLENSTENLRSGSGCGMYDSGKVSCPNCSGQLIVLCPKRAAVEDDKKVEEEAPVADPVSASCEEKPAERKIQQKDACIETDPFPDTVQVAETSVRDLGNISDSGKKGSFCAVCNRLKKESKHDHSGRKKYNARRNCNRNSIKNCYFRNTTHHCSIRPIRQFCYLGNKTCNYHLPKMGRHHYSSILPLFYGNFATCACSPHHLIGFEEKNNHSLELRLMCPKCEKKRKTRKTKFNGSGSKNRGNSRF